MSEPIPGTGLLRDAPDARDYNLSFIAGAPAPIDWSKEFRLPEPPNTNQGSADCCVGESFSSFHWQLKGKPFSVRSLFAYIALTPYGAYLRDGAKRIIDAGQETFDEAPDPLPKTAKNMRSKAGLDESLGLDDRETSFFNTNGKSIDQVAQAIRDFGGVVFGLDVSAFGWLDKTNPRPPQAGEAIAGHALYGMGFHLHDGVKCIIAKSSWCEPGHHEHHIKNNYFESGSTYSEAFVLVPKEQLSMIRRFKVDDHGTLGVALIVDGSFDFTVYRAKSEEHYAALLKFYEVPDNAPTIKIP